MSLPTFPEVTSTQIPFRQVGNQVFSSGVFQKQSVKKIVATGISKCNFSFTDFKNIFSFEIEDIIWSEFSDQIIIKLEYSDKFKINLTLKGDWELEDDQRFHLKEVDWNFEEKENDSVSVFVLKTFLSLLCLSNKIKVDFPDINYWFNVSIPISLDEISEILRHRQLAHRLMVIEKAFDLSLPFPKRFIEGKEIANISYCYLSVVDRKFEWDCSPSFISWSATSMYLSLLPENNQPFSMQYGPEPFSKEVLGCRIDLGLQTARIDDYVIDDFDEVKEKLSKLDGSKVLVQARSLRGIVQIESITTPTLPENSFSPEIQELIDIDEKLGSLFFNKYANSFSNAFERLSDEQIEAITERPNLENDAFNF